MRDKYQVKTIFLTFRFPKIGTYGKAENSIRLFYYLLGLGLDLACDEVCARELPAVFFNIRPFFYCNSRSLCGNKITRSKS